MLGYPWENSELYIYIYTYVYTYTYIYIYGDTMGYQVWGLTVMMENEQPKLLYLGIKRKRTWNIKWKLRLAGGGSL